MRFATHRSQMTALAAAAMVLSSLAGCSSGGSDATSTTTTRDDGEGKDQAATTTSSTEARTYTSGDELPPPVGKDDDLLSGNMTTNTSEWLQLVLDESGVPNRVTANNYAQMPIDLSLSITEQANLRTEPELPARISVEALAANAVAALGPLDESAEWSFEYSYGYELGDPAAKATSFAYGSPFPDDVKSKVIQEPEGKVSHQAPDTKFAIDLAVPEGTPVLAIRPGVVATIDQGFTEAGTDADEFADRGNSIRVLHDDGTWAIYLGLAPKSSRVMIGDEVKVGDLLAVSGFTGLAAEAHLHLAIVINKDHVATSLPFKLPS